MSVPLRQRVIRDTMLYTAANVFAMAVGIVVSLATKAILGPIGAGYWTLMKVFQSYGEYADLGTRDALLREIPQLRGAGQQERADGARDAVFSFIAVSSLAASCFLAALSFFVSDPVLALCLKAVAALVLATHFYNFFLTYLRTLNRVGALSLVIVVNMLFVAAASIAGARWGGAFGLGAGVTVSTALSVFVAARAAGFTPRFNARRAEILRLIKIGLPMVVSSYALITFLSVDALVAGKFLGVEQLGFYTIALMSVQQINALGRFTHIILFPHIQERYGRTGSLEESKGFFLRTTDALACCLPVVIALVVFGVPLLVHWLLPRFEPGLAAMKVLAVGYFFVAVSEMGSTVLFTVNRQKDLIPLYLAAVLVSGAFNIAVVRAGWGLLGVAAATSAAYFVFFAMVAGYSFSRLLPPAALAAMLARIAGIFVYFAGVLAVVDRGVRLESPGMEALVKTALFLAAYAPVLYFFEKREGLAASVFHMMAAKMRRRPA